MSYPIIENNINDIIEQLTLIDKYNIHPAILQLFVTNFIHNSCINEIINNNNKKIINSISDINSEIELIFSIFNDVFNEIDSEYKDVEELIGFNKLSNLDHDSFVNTLNETIMNDNNDNLYKINLFLISINHNSHNFCDDYYENMKKDISNITNKYDFDMKLFNDLNQQYKSDILISFNDLKLYNCFANMSINISDVISATDKFIFYFWIDIISQINKKFFDNHFTTH